MIMIYRFLLTILIILLTFSGVNAQRGFFTDVPPVNIPGTRVLIPEKARTLYADTGQLKQFLWSLPSEATVDPGQAPVMALPMPDGSTAMFRVWESSVQEPGLQEMFPEIRTFSGQGIDDPYATVRMDYNPYFGFHAQVLTVNGSYYIDPYARGNITYYNSYFRTDYRKKFPLVCEVQDDDMPMMKVLNTMAGPCRGPQLYSYRLAIACTGEYAIAVGGTTPAALHSAIVTTVNRVNGVYEKELAVRLVLIDNNQQIEFMNPSTDPFNGNNNAGVLINESQNVINSTIGAANYDIGHTFSTGGGGLASLGVVCNSSSKARGITGSPVPVGDPYDIDYVAHEIGHQFGATHSFNGNAGSCGGSRSASAAYEPGSGTTIQAYAGICGSDNIQPNSDPHFHPISYDQIANYIEAGGNFCKTVINTGNNIPQITAMNFNNANIPLNTPFVLTGTATDPDGDAITYSWEEWDLGPAGSWSSGGNSTTAPLFKSRIPKTTGSRTFPDIAVILAGYPVSPVAAMGGLKGETLPKVGRSMKFRLTVRDNRAGGGAITSGGSGCQAGFTGIFQVNAISGTGPFRVLVPNGGQNYTGGTANLVTWDVAGTASSPINTTHVRITLSTDGGFTYPIELIASTPNDGSEMITFPVVPTTTARVRIEAVNNIYFDISDNNFTITASGVGFEFVPPAATNISCGSQTSAAATLGTTSINGFSSPISLSATGNPSGTTVTFSPNPVTPGNNTTVTLNNTHLLATGTYNITVTGIAGSITKTTVLSYSVQAGAGPVISMQPQDRAVCESGIATFTVTAPGTSYQWQVSTDGGNNFSNIPNATSASYSITGVTPSMNNNRYRVLVTGQCGTTTSSAAMLTVFPLPLVSLTASPYTRLFPGLQTTLTANSNPATGVSYAWYRNSVLLPGLSGNTLTVTAAELGNYMVQVTDANGCVNQSQALSIADSVTSHLFIYPSPNQGRFTVSYYNPSGSTVRQVSVFDAHGALVFKNEYPVSQRYQLLDVNLWNVSRGIYLVLLTDNDGKKIAAGKVLVH